jgi:hypothetical protein
MDTRSKKSGIVLGGLLIVFGVMALLETMIDLGAWVWVAVLTIGGLGIYAIYATDRTEKLLLIIPVQSHELGVADPGLCTTGDWRVCAPRRIGCLG